MIVEVSPSDLRGRVEPHVRNVIRAGTAVATPTMQGQGEMRRLLDDALRAHAVYWGFHSLSNDGLKARLAEALVDRESEIYRRQAEFAEHVKNTIDDVEAELERCGVPLPCR